MIILEQNIGFFIKKIRINKGLKAKEVYDGIMSRSMYYKFENNLADISHNLFLELCSRLNISLHEILTMINITTDYQYIFSIIYKSFYKNKKDLHCLNLKFQQLHTQNPYNTKYYHYLLLTELLITYQKNKTLDLSSIKPIKNFLTTTESWSHYEYTLFKHVIFIYKDDELVYLYPQLVKTIKRIFHYNNSNEHYKLLSIILYTLFNNYNLQHTSYFIEELTKINNKKISMFYKTITQFYIALYLYINNDYTEKKNIEKILDFFQFIEMDEVYKFHLNLYQKYKKKRS